MKTLSYKIVKSEITPGGNWNVAKDWFPRVNVNQETGCVEIESFYTSGRQKKASVDTNEITVKLSDDQTQMLITGSVEVKNWSNCKCSGEQNFVFAVFEGDSGHIYIHRAPASKGWRECNPELIRKRLVKLGIGATQNVLQQGDFLLKPANGSSLPVENFKHEWSSASHHKFDQPVLSEYVSGIGRIIYIPEGCFVMLHHEAVDGIQHPSIEVPSGQYIIGSTASQLNHSNQRD